MRTALVLLFLLALAAVPGSLLPQRSLNPAKVQAYLATHGAWGRLVDSIGGFDVFGSVWFSAIYLLLFMSLIGCLIPRIRVYARALATKPLPAPRTLSRLAENGRLESEATPDEVASTASRMLRPRWRTTTRAEAGGAVTVSAEKGYSREAGNLLFHVALLTALVLIAAGKLLSYQGSNVVVEGTGFCNPGLYDSFHAGRGVDEQKIARFCVDSLDSFTAAYRDDGSPAQYKAALTYSEGVDGTPRHGVITVNHPLRLMGDRIYLINHGFAPTVTITRKGKTPVTDTEPFLPQDGFLTSEGVFVLLGPDGARQDIGLQGLFAPTPQDQGNGVITSVAPEADHPVLALFAFTGDSGRGNGLPQSVYSLDTSKMTKVAGQNLSVGQTMKLPDGTTVRFDGYRQWVSLQVSHDPTQTYLLIVAVLMVVGLLGSLAVRRRRVWIRVLPGPGANGGTGARTLIDVGGLARNDSGNFTQEFAGMFGDLRSALDRASGAATTGDHLAGDDAIEPAGAGKD
jgi:cytochrome c biogenesis protein